MQRLLNVKLSPYNQALVSNINQDALAERVPLKLSEMFDWDALDAKAAVLVPKGHAGAAERAKVQDVISF